MRSSRYLLILSDDYVIFSAENDTNTLYTEI